jgi:hypothetical protein
MRDELFLEDRQTDRHDEANSRVSQFCQRTSKMYILPTLYLLTGLCLFNNKQHFFTVH